MHSVPFAERLAVCSWSLQPTDPQDLAAKLLATGVRRVQLNLDPLRESPAAWGESEQVLRKAGISIISGMCLCVGEDYSTLESIRVTGGIAPDATWTQNQQNFQAYAAIAAKLGLNLVSFHAGFVPHDEADPAFARMVERLRAVAEIFKPQNILVDTEARVTLIDTDSYWGSTSVTEQASTALRIA